jgi:transposase
MDRLPHNLPITDAATAAPLRRVEVITGVARRRRWSEQDKARIVAESRQPGVAVADVARRHGIHRNQLYSWRGAFADRPHRPGPAEAPGFVPVTVVPGEAPEPAAGPAPAGGVIEIALGPVTVRLTGPVDAAALRRVLQVIRGLA